MVAAADRASPERRLIHGGQEDESSHNFDGRAASCDALDSLDFALALRAWIGVLLTALLFVPILARIESEEALLEAQFRR